MGPFYYLDCLALLGLQRLWRFLLRPWHFLLVPLALYLALIDESQWLLDRYDQLALIDEKRMAAIFHGQLYQQRVSRSYNIKVRSREFKENDLVLKKVISCQDEAKGKFAPNWEGHFVVKTVLTKGALILQEKDGEIFPQALNADSVKRYYP